MVPVYFDVQRGKMKVWALLGWRTTAVEVTYRAPPTGAGIKALAGAGRSPGEPPPVQFGGDRYEFAAPVMAEVYVERLLDRDDDPVPPALRPPQGPGTPSWPTSSL